MLLIYIVCYYLSLLIIKDLLAHFHKGGLNQIHDLDAVRGLK